MGSGKFSDQLADLDDLFRIEACGWFVKDQYGRIMDKRLRESNALFETSGQIGDQAPPHLSQP